ncbi:MAG TPA: aspartate/glutamate racemase family protein [Ideonella sp.]|nr:aspartate/glutamate racemase family protein [Ideonella sp.]
MKTLGLLGGMSWESTLVYYRLINQGVATRLGGLHSAKLLLASLEFDEIAAMQRSGEWARAGELLGQAGAGLRQAGAQALLIATNTMHKVAPTVAQVSGLPLLHIGDATGAAIRAAGCSRVGLLGTRFSMEDPFLVDHLAHRFGIETVVPGAAARAELHRIIFEELCQGRLVDSSREHFRRAIGAMAAEGCEAVILGCTEISLLVDPAATGWPVPLFDTTALHARAAVAWLTEDSPEANK